LREVRVAVADGDEFDVLGIKEGFNLHQFARLILAEGSAKATQKEDAVERERERERAGEREREIERKCG
jgi:hypothetical protein